MIEFKPEIGMRIYIDEQLEQFGFHFNNGLTTLENLKAVFALQRRIPSVKRRIVIELPGIQVPKETEKAYESIRRKLTLGLSIKPHLSLSTSKYTYNDLLLNSWNIHHLHLSEEPYKKGFFKRTGPVLFCMFFENAVVFIDIMPHGIGYSDVWVNEELIKRLHKYLPESLEQYKMKDITGDNLDSKQRLVLQKNHCNYAMRMEDGTVYQLMGIMSNGDSFHDIHRLMHVQRMVDYFSQVIKADEKAFKQSLEIKDTESLELTIAFHENDIKLYAPKQETIFNINHPK
ncbi:TPA: hypothetical protein MC583_004826 [Escherichia coli]|uniref:hypothetical protein n=1 Tax=Escherichia coli TaxID=562 RepID=UPI000BE61DD3|nr:hypothetical protein [Escherichia coli]EFI4198080.1 hypothetical protein [Escherichia coli]EFI4246148.1 hypothetical protein [Escherichia coli]EFI5848823.1 hypothetical protein [Escherichia coli]EFI8298424.1 hypothetical protein [Escherichia coli]EFI9516682.1 hypothetical protein [Escherichia coli]